MVVDHRNWYKIELKELGGITAFGDAPSNWNEFEAQYEPIIKWCQENCDKKYYRVFAIDDGWHTDSLWVGYRFYFKYKADATGFKLRWL